MSHRSTPVDGAGDPLFYQRAVAYLKSEGVTSPLSIAQFDALFDRDLCTLAAGVRINVVWSEVENPREMQLWCGTVHKVFADGIEVAWHVQNDTRLANPEIGRLFTPQEIHVWRIAIRRSDNTGLVFTTACPTGSNTIRSVNVGVDSDTDTGFLLVPGEDDIPEGVSEVAAEMRGTAAAVVAQISGLDKRLAHVSDRSNALAGRLDREFATNDALDRLVAKVAEMDAGVGELAEDLASKIEEISADGATAALVATHTSDIDVHAKLIRGLQQMIDNLNANVNRLMTENADLRSEVHRLAAKVDSRIPDGSGVINPARTQRYLQAFNAKVQQATASAPTSPSKRAQPSERVIYDKPATWPIILDVDTGANLLGHLERKFGPNATAKGGMLFDKFTVTKAAEDAAYGAPGISQAKREKAFLDEHAHDINTRFRNLMRALNERHRNFVAHAADGLAHDVDAAEDFKTSPADVSAFANVDEAYYALLTVIEARYKGLERNGERALLERYRRDTRAANMTEVQHAVSIQMQEQLMAANNATAAAIATAAARGAAKGGGAGANDKRQQPTSAPAKKQNFGGGGESKH
jgi:hypothetical protein